MHLDTKRLIAARDQLLETALRFFCSEPAVIGVFLAGSLAANKADAYSDIDLRVVLPTNWHITYVDQRLDIPKQWQGFLFNEWAPNTQHCVSHFRPFVKIDIFYYDAVTLSPSPWYRHPIKILHDPRGVIADLIRRSSQLSFSVSEDNLDFSISKALAAAHETYRRAQRGELFYALSLLDDLRKHIMHADDWLNARSPETTVSAKFDIRGTETVLTTLRASYIPCQADAILIALHRLLTTYRLQVVDLHARFNPSRPLTADLEAIDILLLAPLASTGNNRPAVKAT